jgi:hypothetical protein
MPPRRPDPDALALKALQLFSVRSGARVLVLPITGVAGLTGSLARSRRRSWSSPAHASDDDVARWAYRVRARRAPADDALSPRRAEAARTTARVLPDSAGEAHRLVLDILDGRPRGWPLRLKTTSHSRMTAVR